MTIIIMLKKSLVTDCNKFFTANSNIFELPIDSKIKKALPVTHIQKVQFEDIMQNSN